METSEVLKKMLDKPKDPYKKICKYKPCQKEFIANRLNQEYCCPECKMKANNLKSKAKRDATKLTNITLLKNREILKDFHDKGQVNVSLQELQELGFEYEFHTQRKKETKLDIMVPFYYEYGLIPEKEQSPEFFTIWKQ